jgi:hypothetical protein
MKRASSPAITTELTVLIHGIGGTIPQEIPGPGLLIYRDSPNVITYWGGDEWVPLNRTGFFAKFRCDFPNIPIGEWAIVTAERLTITSGDLLQQITRVGLMMALHASQMLPAEKNPNVVSDQVIEDPEFDAVREDVEPFIR